MQDPKGFHFLDPARGLGWCLTSSGVQTKSAVEPLRVRACCSMGMVFNWLEFQSIHGVSCYNALPGTVIDRLWVLVSSASLIDRFTSFWEQLFRPIPI